MNEVRSGQLYKMEGTVYKVLACDAGQVLVINCRKTSMPKWLSETEIFGQEAASADDIPTLGRAGELTDKELVTVRKRYTMIAGILPYIAEDTMRNMLIKKAADINGVSKRTVTTYLCRYLVHEDISALADKETIRKEKPMTKDQKNMRWALNKFYYTRRGNSLMDSYIQLLKAKYCDADGQLLPDYPTIYQFRYFYHKTRKLQTEIISRKGIKEYQLNHRPLLGDGVQEMAPAAGWGMLDGTICDIYLVDESGSLVGRPVLLANVDAYSGICMGYALLWEGGVYSVRELLLNTLEDKVAWCRKFGIKIKKEQWPCAGELPGYLVTDRGSEYISYNFEQITELGCQVLSLSSFSANMKGPVEKLFDLVQDSYKPYLKGKGVIEPDFQKRGAMDYRKEACLTIEQFEKIIICCILYHNSQRVVENFPYTAEMVNQEVAPLSNALWVYGKTLPGANLISCTREKLVMTLLPRIDGRFTRKGLIVNGLRYSAEGFTEEYLRGGEVKVAYNPDDVSYIYLIRDGYIRFQLIESRYGGKTLEQVQSIKDKQNSLVKECQEKNLQARIDLARHIEVLAETGTHSGDVKLSEIRKTRQKAKNKRHRDLVKEVVDNV